jgi:hypothetical protein
VRLSPYLYALSLPERTLRSAGALGGGLLREVSDLVLPATVREATLYRATAGIGLRFLIQQVGNVPGIYPNSDSLSRRFVLRYATGMSIETASMLAVFVSPVWVLAALGDATRMAKTLFAEIGESLQHEGLLDPNDRFETMTQLLDGLERTSTHLALSVNMPPLDISGLRAEWEQFRQSGYLANRVFAKSGHRRACMDGFAQYRQDLASIRARCFNGYCPFGAAVCATRSPAALASGGYSSANHRDGCRWCFSRTLRGRVQRDHGDRVRALLGQALAPLPGSGDPQPSAGKAHLVRTASNKIGAAGTPGASLAECSKSLLADRIFPRALRFRRSFSHGHALNSR